MLLSRRAFLAGVVAGAAAACSDGDGDSASRSTTSTTAAQPSTTLPAPELSGPPFTLGVASGDPLPNSVILWTRLAPAPLAGGGMPGQDVSVLWEVAADERFEDVVQEGVATATPALGHSVHVDVGELEPATTYWYRFRVGDFESPVGRTKTSPAEGDSPEALRFAYASCQQWQDGYWTAYPHMAEEDLDLVVFLGDYIYEGGVNEGGTRQHDGPEPTTLEGYRNRYGLYKGDLGLQAAHAAFPWLVVWDDHEVENNYADASPQDGSASDAFLIRRAAAYQAYYEHQPLRLEPPSTPDFPIYRRLAHGDLATFHLLDTRQYRSNQACMAGSDIGAACPEVGAEERTLLGEEQEAWLADGLRSSDTRWNVLANQVILGRTAIPLGETTFYNLDQWDGYTASRQRLFDVLGELEDANTIVITGDIHLSGVGDLKADFDDLSSRTLGTEFVGTSISSLFTEGFIDIVETAAAAAPYVSYVNARERGYVRCEVTRDQWRTDYRLVESIATPEADIRTAVSFAVDAGRPGVRQID